MEKPKRTIEQQTADVILQRSVATVRIGGKTYNVAPPSVATLILISEEISTLPAIAKAPENGGETAKADIFRAVISNARHFRKLGDVAAILILGAKGLTQEVETEEKERPLWGVIPRKRKVKRIIDKKSELAKEIIENLSSSQLYELLIDRIKDLDLTNFFVITTSLTAMNITKPTKEVE